jgi:tetratricopeptide (TPR) repeat protein
MPLDDLSSSQDRSWIGEAFAQAIAAHFQSGGREIVGTVELHRYLREKGLAPNAPITRATVIVIGRELGASRAVVGSYSVTENQIEASLKVLDLEKGSIIGVIEDHDDLDNLLELENRFAKNLFRLESDAVPASFATFSAYRRRLSLDAHERLAKARLESIPSERQRLLEEAIEIQPDYIEAKLLLGYLLLEEDEPVKAIRVLRSFEPDEYVYREAYFLLGLAYLDANQTAAAKEIFTHLANQEGKATFLNNLGIAFMRTGDIERAIESFAEAVEQDDGESLFRFNLGWAHWRAGKGAEALESFREVVKQDPEDGEAHLLLAAAAAAQAHAEEASEERARAIAIEPKLADVDASTVEGMERVSRDLPPRTGEALSGSADPTANESLQELLQRARALRASGQLDEGIKELQRGLYLQPHWVEARLELADFYREAGELEKALGEYRVALWDEENADTHLRVAKLYVEMENPQRARVHAERAIELEPGREEAQRLLDTLK